MNHLAIIADGNRRWAVNHSLPSQSGYLQGLVSIENCCDWAINNKIQFLTVYCFSTENWGRGKNEVDMLFVLADHYLEDRQEWYINRGIKVTFAGRRDRFKPEFQMKMHNLDVATQCGPNLSLVVCIDYGGKDEIIRAIESGAKTDKEISDFVSHGSPDPDAILRTGGAMRLSNFLLWQSAYSELFFIQTLFPELTHENLDHVLQDYKTRTRNYGK